jgi:large subunit ribosomal protein L32e
MVNEDMITILTSLKGIGKAKAEALIAAGYDTTEKIKSASIENLTKVAGISVSVAESILSQLQMREETSLDSKIPEEKSLEKSKKTEKEEPEQESEEKKSVKEREIQDEKEEYETKKKPDLSDQLKHSLPIRKELKNRTPHFYREEWFRYKRLGKSWRRPDGISSKMRRNFKYRPNKVRVGFRGPVKSRGLHPSGFEEIMVYNCNDLEMINPKTQAARIGGAVGMRKRVEIEKKANELDIRILNK